MGGPIHISARLCKYRSAPSLNNAFSIFTRINKYKSRTEGKCHDFDVFLLLSKSECLPSICKVPPDIACSIIMDFKKNFILKIDILCDNCVMYIIHFCHECFLRMKLKFDRNQQKSLAGTSRVAEDIWFGK